MIISDRTFKNYFTIAMSGKKTFYASDFGLNGGEISALSYVGLISPTGNTRETSIEIPYGNGVYKKVTVKEWQIDSNIKYGYLLSMKNFLNNVVKDKDNLQQLLDISDTLLCRLNKATKRYSEYTPFSQIFSGIDFINFINESWG
jgi:hypothetical protein